MEKYCIRTLDNKVHTLFGDNALVELIEEYMGKEVSDELVGWIDAVEEANGLEEENYKLTYQLGDLEDDISKLENEIYSLTEDNRVLENKLEEANKKAV